MNHHRSLSQPFPQALADTRGALPQGARQAGKSTLAQEITQQVGGRYVSLDDPALLHAARSDPTGFVRTADRLLAIDEVQLAPHLFRAIKTEVDRDPRPATRDPVVFC